MAKRPDKLVFKGKRGAAGEPLEFFAGVPARDLDEADIRRLSDAELKEITGGDRPLYAEPGGRKDPPKPAPKADAPPRKRPARKAAEPKPAAKQDAAAHDPAAGVAADAGEAAPGEPAGDGGA